MAVTYQSVATVSYANITSGGTLTITKPSGLAVGDLMVVHIAFRQVGGGGVAGLGFTNSGWDSLDNVDNSFSTVTTDDEVGISVAYRVATSGDVAASDFSFTRSGLGTLGVAGAIYRMDGQDPTPVSAWLSASVSNDSTPSFATGITPTPSCLLFIISSSYDSGATPTGISTYAITTSDPGWTERYDIVDSAGTVMSGATGTRPESTSTGAWSFTVNSGSAACDSVSILLAIKPIADATVSVGVNVISISQPDPVITAGATPTPAVQVIIPSIPTPTITATDSIYSNQTKNSSTFTNQSKNSSSFTNQSKTSSTFTNQTKSPDNN